MIKTVEAFDNPPATISTSTPAEDPAICSIGNDVFMVWVEDYEIEPLVYQKEVFFAYSPYSGETNTWIYVPGAGTPISLADGYESWMPDISVTGNEVHICWTYGIYPLSVPGTGIWYKFSLDRGQTWAGEYQVAGWQQGRPVHDPHIASSDNGNQAGPGIAHIVFSEIHNHGQGGVPGQIYHVTNAPSPVTVVSRNLVPDSQASNPDVAVFGTYVHVVWDEYNYNPTSPPPPPQPKNSVIKFRRGVNDGTVWPVNPTTISPVPGGDRYYHAKDPAIASEGEYVHVVWTDNALPTWEVYYLTHRDNGDLVLGSWWPTSIRGGGFWGNPVSGWPTVDSIEPDIAVDIDIHVVWTEVFNSGPSVHYDYSIDYGITWNLDSSVWSMDSLKPAIAASMGEVHVVFESIYVQQTVMYSGSRNSPDWLMYKDDVRNTGYNKAYAPDPWGGLSPQSPATLDICPTAVGSCDNSQPLVLGDRVYMAWTSGWWGGYTILPEVPSPGWTRISAITAIPPANPNLWIMSIHNTPAIAAEVPQSAWMVIADGGNRIYRIDNIYPGNTGAETIGWCWTPSAGGPPGTFKFSSPTLATIGGTMYCYIGDEDGYIYCFNTGNGALVWSTQVSSNPIRSTPAVVENNAPNTWPGSSERVVFADTGGVVYCMDALPADAIDEGFTDGGGGAFDIVWQFNTGAAIDTQSPVVIHNRVYIGTLDDGNGASTFFCLDLEGFNDGVDDGYTPDTWPGHNQAVDFADIFWYYQRSKLTSHNFIGWGDAAVHHGKVFVGFMEEFYEPSDGLFHDIYTLYVFDEYGWMSGRGEDNSDDMISNVGFPSDELWTYSVTGAFWTPCKPPRSVAISDQTVVFTFRGNLYFHEEYNNPSLPPSGTGYLGASTIDRYSPSPTISDDGVNGYCYIPNGDYISGVW